MCQLPGDTEYSWKELFLSHIPPLSVELFAPELDLADFAVQSFFQLGKKHFVRLPLGAKELVLWAPLGLA